MFLQAAPFITCYAGREISVADLTHPHYDQHLREWQKWRLTYQSGLQFLNAYLKPFTKRESIEDFMDRKSWSYVPAFAKAAIDEIKNSIYQRLVDIQRIGGSQSYIDAVAGRNNGVDLLGSSMNAFIGRKVLPELLTMAKVGIFVDAPPALGPTLADTKGWRPYVFLYQAEDIRSWVYDDGQDSNEFTSVLLRDHAFTYDPKTKLPSGTQTRYRHMWIEDGSVFIQFFNEVGKETDQFGVPSHEPVKLNIPRIPFVVLEITNSLLVDVADYQIALLQLASSDLNYVLKANFPFYTEQYDTKTQAAYLRHKGLDAPGTGADAQAGKSEEIKVGVQTGRRYPIGTERPAFINPSSEPLRASMEKQEQMKEEIRLLMQLAITNLQPRMASAESKGFDERSLESGLSYIGLELEVGERKIAHFWEMYFNGATPPATIHYPEKYNLKSDEERRKDADQLEKLKTTVPSPTYQREVSKQIATIVVGTRVSVDTLNKIYQEIDEAPVPEVEPSVIIQDVQAGLVDLETASQARGYPKGVVEKAKKEHEERLKRIAESQTKGQGPGASLVNPGARGIPDQDPNPGQSGKKEKAQSKVTTPSGLQASKTRGPGKNNKREEID